MNRTSHFLSVRAAPWIPATLVVAIAAAIRLAGLGTDSLWLDEAWSYWFTQQSWWYLWSEVPRFEIHPPVFYSLLKLWTALGDGEFVLRLLPLLFGTACAGLVFVICKAALPARTSVISAVTAGLFVAAHPLQIHYSQDVRPYAMLAFAYAVLLAGTVWLAANVRLSGVPIWRPRHPDRYAPGANEARFAWGAVVVGSVLCLWTNNTAVLFVAACGLPLAFVICYSAWRDDVPVSAVYNGIACLVAILAIWGPWIPVLIQQVTLVPEDFWIQLDRYRLHRTAGDFLTFSFPGLTRRNLIFAYGILPASLALLGFGYLLRKTPFVAVVLASSLLFPLVASLAISVVSRPIFVSKALLPVAIPFAVFIGFGIQALWESRKALGGVAALALAALSGHGAWNYTIGPSHTEPWRDAAALISESYVEGEVILAVPNYVEIPLQYYFQRMKGGPADYEIRGLPRPYPELSVMGDDAFRDIDVAPWFEASRGVWIVTRGQPESDQHHRTLSTADGMGTRVLEQRFGYLIAVYYFRPEPAG